MEVSSDARNAPAHRQIPVSAVRWIALSPPGDGGVPRDCRELLEQVMAPADNGKSDGRPALSGLTGDGPWPW
jgi:hypothetical protein